MINLKYLIKWNLSGDFENPTVEIPGRRAKASDVYLESPLFAFLILILHCIGVAFESIAKKKG